MPSKATAHAHSVECACIVGPGHKAVAVDPALKQSNQKRLRRIEGQVRGLQKMVGDDPSCGDIIIQIASVQEALRSAKKEEANAMYDELLSLIYTRLR